MPGQTVLAEGRNNNNNLVCAQLLLTGFSTPEHHCLAGLSQTDRGTGEAGGGDGSDSRFKCKARVIPVHQPLPDTGSDKR